MTRIRPHLALGVAALAGVLLLAAGLTAFALTPSAVPAGCADLPAAPAAAAVPGSVSVTDFGARADDDVDDTAGLRRAFAAVPPGGTIVLPPGCYLHEDTLAVGVRGVRLVGAGARLVATSEERSSVSVDADAVEIEGLQLAVPGTTRRWEASPQMALSLGPRDGIVVRDVTVLGSAASGVFVDGASNFVLDRVGVRDSRADGIHITAGARNGSVLDASVERSGDDGVAVVSYADGHPPCRWIQVVRPRVSDQTWGRGLSVVGGQDITFSDVSVSDSDSAAVYVATEGAPYFTHATDHVAVVGGRLVRSNRNPSIRHGAVLVYSGRPGLGVTDVLVQGLTIDSTSPSAGQDIGIRTSGGGVDRVRLEQLVIRTSAGTPLRANVPSDRYRADGWTVDGKPYAPRP